MHEAERGKLVSSNIANDFDMNNKSDECTVLCGARYCNPRDRIIIVTCGCLAKGNWTVLQLRNSTLCLVSPSVSNGLVVQVFL